MVLGVVLARKRYPLAKYLFVLMIVLGVALFMYKPKNVQKNLDSDHTFGWGEVLLVRTHFWGIPTHTFTYLCTLTHTYGSLHILVHTYTYLCTLAHTCAYWCILVHINFLGFELWDPNIWLIQGLKLERNKAGRGFYEKTILGKAIKIRISYVCYNPPCYLMAGPCTHDEYWLLWV